MSIGQSSPPIHREHPPATAVRAAAKGDARSFRLLYESYAPSIYNMALRSARDPQAAEDVCQEIWIKGYRKLRTLRDPEAFSAWLYRIAAQTCIDAGRRRTRHPHEAEIPETARASGPLPEDSAEGEEQGQLAWEALGTLPPHQHVALYLREVEEFTYAQIAHALAISVDAVGVLLHRGRRALARSYALLEHEPDARCEQARSVMPAVMDGEHTKVQRRALQAHVQACDACRIELADLQAASGAYRRLPLVAPAPLMAGKIIASAGVPASGGAGAGLMSWLAALAGAGAPSLGAVAVTAVAVSVGAAVASTEIPPEPANGPQAVTLLRTHTGPEARLGSTPEPGSSAASDTHAPPSGGRAGEGDQASNPAPPASDPALIPVPPDPTAGVPYSGPVETLLGESTGSALQGTKQTVEEAVEVVDETLELVDGTVEDIVEDVPALDEPLPPPPEAVEDVVEDLPEVEPVVDDVEEIVEDVLDTLLPTPTPGPTGEGDLLPPLLP